jgi:hypothetical protein
MYDRVGQPTFQTKCWREGRLDRLDDYCLPDYLIRDPTYFAFCLSTDGCICDDTRLALQ